MPSFAIRMLLFAAPLPQSSILDQLFKEFHLAKNDTLNAPPIVLGRRSNHCELPLKNNALLLTIPYPTITSPYNSPFQPFTIGS
jgi:hypothetical protein